MAERWRTQRHRPQDERDEQEERFGSEWGSEDEPWRRRQGSSWREGQERGRYGGSMGEPYRQGYYGSEQTGNWSPYEDRDPSGRGGFPSSWAGGERGGRMGWPRFGQGGAGEGHEWGGPSRSRQIAQRRGWQGGHYGQMGYEGEGMPWESSRGGRPGDDMAQRMGDWRQHQDEGGQYGREYGPYRGRGPRGYTRSDDRIREDVNDCLCDDPFIDASNIDVQVSKGEVTLSGTVDSRSAKRRAEDLVEDISGVQQCQNNIRVQHEQEAGRMATASGGATQQRGR